MLARRICAPEQPLRDRRQPAAEQAPRDVGHRDGAHQLGQVVGQLGQRARQPAGQQRLQPRRRRPARALVVGRRGAVARQAPQQAAGDPVRGLGQQVAIEVVPVRRPDAVGEPDAGVAHLHPCGLQPGGEAGERGRGVQRDRGVDAQRPRRSPAPTGARARRRGCRARRRPRARGPAARRARAGPARRPPSPVAGDPPPARRCRRAARDARCRRGRRAGRRAPRGGAGRRGPGGRRGADRRRRAWSRGRDDGTGGPNEVVPRENPGHQPTTPAAPERRRSTGTQCDEARGPRPTAAGRRGRSSAATFAASFHELCSRPAAQRRRVQTSGAARAR